MTYTEGLNTKIENVLEKVEQEKIDGPAKDIILDLLRELSLNGLSDTDAMINMLELFEENPKETRPLFRDFKTSLVVFRSNLPNATWWGKLGGFPDEHQKRTVFFSKESVRTYRKKHGGK